MPIDALLDGASGDTSKVHPLTAQMVWREVMRDEVSALEKLAGQRMDAIERSVITETAAGQARLSHMKEVLESKLDTHDEKFNSIQLQFEDRDRSVEAAFLAAKESVVEQHSSSATAIAKSEAAMDKRIESLGTLIATTREALASSITDIKERISRIESAAQGRNEQRNMARDDTKTWTSIIGVITSVLSIIVGVLIGYFTRPH